MLFPPSGAPAAGVVVLAFEHLGDRLEAGEDHADQRHDHDQQLHQPDDEQAHSARMPPLGLRLRRIPGAQQQRDDDQGDSGDFQGRRYLAQHGDTDQGRRHGQERQQQRELCTPDLD